MTSASIDEINAILTRIVQADYPDIEEERLVAPVAYDLRLYQRVIADRMLAAAAKGQPWRQIVVLPTGAGKTVVAAYVIRQLISEGHRGIMMAPRKELWAQASEKVSAMGVPHAIVAGGVKPDLDADFFVGTPQSVLRRGWPPGLTFAIVDEAHLDFKKPDGMPPLVFGLTATPVWSDGSGMGDEYDEMVEGPSTPELIAAGSVLPARVFAPHIPDLKDVVVRGGEITEESASLAMGGIIKDIVGTWIKTVAGKTTILFTPSVKLAEEVADLFRKADVSAEAVSAESKPAYRRACFDAMRDGRLKVITNVGIAGMGWDMPCVEVVADAAPTISLPLYLQRAGRGSRPYRDQTAYILLDFAGNWLRHGRPDVAQKWDLHAEKRPKKEALTSKPLPVCPACQFVLPEKWGGQPCPECGSDRAGKPRRVKYVKGELVEVRDAEPPKTPTVLHFQQREARRRQVIGICTYQKRFPQPAAIRHAAIALEEYEKELAHNPNRNWEDWMRDNGLLKKRTA